MTRLEDFAFVLASNDLDDHLIAELEVSVSDELRRKLKRRAVGNSYSASSDGTSAIQTDVSYLPDTDVRMFTSFSDRRGQLNLTGTAIAISGLGRLRKLQPASFSDDHLATNVRLQHVQSS